MFEVFLHKMLSWSCTSKALGFSLPPTRKTLNESHLSSFVSISLPQENVVNSKAIEKILLWTNSFKFFKDEIPLWFLHHSTIYWYTKDMSVASIHKNRFFASFEGKKVQHVDHHILQRKILEKLTVTETGHKLRLLQRKSRRERDYENCTKSQTKGICGKKPFFPNLWREVVFLLIW